MSSSSAAVSRRDVVRACKRRGWTIQPAALGGILQCATAEREVSDLLDVLARHGMMDGHKTVTAAHWQRLLREREEEEQQQQQSSSSARNRSSSTGSKQRQQQARMRQAGGAASSSNDLEVVSAFETPKLVYESMRKQFRVETQSRPLFGTAEDKVNMLSQRYALIHQRLLRHDLFRPNNLGHASATGAGSAQQQQQLKLTPIESLLGKSAKNSANRTILLLAVLTQIEEGQYYLEDPTGQLPASFQSAMAVDGFFVAENCILLVEGSFQDGILFVHRLGHPLLETRSDSLVAIRQQVSHPAFSPPKTVTAGEESAFVLLSDLHLDQPRVLQQLEGLLATYENYSLDRLPVFVVMGNFGSRSFTSAMESNSLSGASLEELGSLISRFTNLAQHAHFVLVPGPHDTSASSVLPCPNLLSRAGFARVQNVHWASNPCRIRWQGREMVIFRYDLLHLLQRQQVLLQEKTSQDGADDEEDMDEDRKHLRSPHCRLVKTVLDQGNLVPVAGVPVYWNCHHALGLYPLPDVLVLGGDAIADGFHEIYGGCHVVHPGSMSRAGNYATFSFPPDVSLEDDDGDDDEEEGDGARVEFGKLGED